MADRRMFSKTITDTDAFLDMPLSTQALYFHLAMHADDEGFVSNPKKIQKMIGASEDDAKLLVLKRFILTFESGVIVIKHWKIHNYIQSDRFKETTYLEEKSMLALDGKKAYIERLDTPWIQNGYNLDTQVSIGKDSIELGKDIEERKKEIYKKSSHAGEGENGRISHAEIMDELGVSGLFREALEGFLRSCFANKHLVTNDKLKDIILRLNKYYGDDDEGKIASLQDAISGGFFDVIEGRKAPPGWRY